MAGDELGRRAGSAARGARRAAARGARATARGTREAARMFRRATHARGAGESGLAPLIELHVVNAAGDAIVAVGLAGTLFFSAPLGEARWRVALYLVITMAPFALMAPVIGPLLDRLGRGRRWAIATTLLLRAFLVVVMAEAISGGRQGLELYPAAFGCLVASRAYGLTRSAVTPRVLPRGDTLVAANARLNLASLITSGVGGGIAAGLAALLGPAWVLRVGMLVFGFGALLAVQLPQRVDVPDDEQETDDAGSAAPTTARRPGRPAGPFWVTDEPHPPSYPSPAGASGSGRSASHQESAAGDGEPTIPVRLPGQRRRRPLPASVVLALRGNAGLRGLSGFLTIFLAFLLRSQPIGGLPTTTALGVIVAGAGVGSVVGTAVGSRLRSRGPQPIVLAMLVLAVAVTAIAALVYSVFTVAAVATAAGLAQSLGKLALDALIQQEVPEAVRASTFARSETLMQLSWVTGGVLGIVLPARGELGLGVAAALLLVVLILTLRARVPRRQVAHRHAPARR